MDPKHELLFDIGRPIPQHEKQKWTEFAIKMSFDQLILLPNADARIQSGMQKPTGYVATIHKQTKFHYEAFCGTGFFRGMARMEVRLPKPPTDAYRAEMTMAVNKAIRDESPFPPRLEALNEKHVSDQSGWVPCLSYAGFIRLDRGRRSMNDPVRYWLTVVAGLPQATLDDLDRKLQALSRKESKDTINDVFIGENSILQPWRKLARANHARLLMDAAMAMGLEVVQEELIHATIAPYDHERKSGKPDLLRRAQEWFGKQPLPAWYVMPLATPRGCPPIADDLIGFELGAYSHDDATMAVVKKPTYMEYIDVHDVMFNDISRYTGDMLAVYSSAVNVHGNNETPFLSQGPLGAITIYNDYKNADWLIPTKFNAFPAEGAYTPSDTMVPTEATVTWEHPAVEKNLNIYARWLFHHPTQDKRAPRLGGVPSDEPDMLLVCLSRRERTNRPHQQQHGHEI